MNQIEGNFQSVRNTAIHYQGWIPEGKVKSILLIAHGVGEHMGRYINVVNHFVPLGFAVYGVDHIGHGKSAGRREFIKGFDDFTQPLSDFYKLVTSWHTGTPVFLYGHSLGGLVASVQLLDHQADFKGAIISAPPVKIPDNISPLTITMGKILSTVAPRAGILGSITSALSHDPEVVRAYDQDPLVYHGKITACISAGMLSAILRLNAEIGKITLPLFILQGSADRIVDPAGAQMLFDKVGSRDKTLKVYQGLYHEVHNEPDRLLMFNDLETWLEAHMN